MCACGCFLLVAIVGGLVYSVMHGLWLAMAAIVLFALIVGWFGRKAAGSRRSKPGQN
jgi:membrane protein implicated in regulation of membrane protease activity